MSAAWPWSRRAQPHGSTRWTARSTPDAVPSRSTATVSHPHRGGCTRGPNVQAALSDAREYRLRVAAHAARRTLQDRVQTLLPELRATAYLVRADLRTASHFTRVTPA